MALELRVRDGLAPEPSCHATRSLSVPAIPATTNATGHVAAAHHHMVPKVETASCSDRNATALTTDAHVTPRARDRAWIIETCVLVMNSRTAREGGCFTGRKQLLVLGPSTCFRKAAGR